jgi:hypothetical protein
MSNVDLIRLPESIEVKVVWPAEAKDFTPWLSDNLHLLDDVGLGPLVFAGKEHAVPGTKRYLDILATMDGGGLVAIENQYSKLDHDHFTRGLAYAVALEAKALLLIAEDHGAEFRAVAQHLNSLYDRAPDASFAVYLVRIKVLKVDQFFVPQFEVVVGPNAFVSQVAAENPKPAVLASVEEFLERCAATRREDFAAIIGCWRQAAMTVSHNAQSAVALYISNPFARTGKTAAFLLDLDGNLTLNRGHLLEGGLGGSPENIAAFDREAARLFPQMSSGPKKYYVRVAPTSPAAVASFAEWINDRLAQQSSLNS